ncbi:MAG: hypothetical protein ABWX85_09705 [Arthrobacter sp.]
MEVIVIETTQLGDRSYLVHDGTVALVIDPQLPATRGRPSPMSQYASVRGLAGEAAPGAALFPTHGFRSFCSSGPASGAASSTLGEQLTSNHALTDPDEDHFVREPSRAGAGTTSPQPPRAAAPSSTCDEPTNTRRRGSRGR